MSTKQTQTKIHVQNSIFVFYNKQIRCIYANIIYLICLPNFPKPFMSILYTPTYQPITNRKHIIYIQFTISPFDNNLMGRIRLIQIFFKINIEFL